MNRDAAVRFWQRRVRVYGTARNYFGAIRNDGAPGSTIGGRFGFELAWQHAGHKRLLTTLNSSVKLRLTQALVNVTPVIPVGNLPSSAYEPTQPFYRESLDAPRKRRRAYKRATRSLC